jgi:spore maturation protein CgeB
MKFVIFGLTISSSWGNGHATLLRGLFRALVRRGHQVVFFERDVPYYADNRDLYSFEDIRLHLYSDWNDAARLAESELRDADVGVVTSYCFDGVAASELILSSAVPLRVFYDLDTPVTLARFSAGEPLSYIGPRALRDFDLVLSYTGGAALEQLQTQLHAPAVAPLYGSVDPEVHCRVPGRPHYSAALSYIGTYAEDRQAMLETLFMTPARNLPEKKFVIAGASYPSQFPWSSNIFFVKHLPPQEHAAFFSSSRLTLNVTRFSMARMGYCPSGRLFEAAACGAPILSDNWAGMERFFAPGSEILIADTVQNAMDAVCLPDSELARYSAAARERVMESHTADRRAIELEEILESAWRPPPGVKIADSGAQPSM